MPNTTKLVSKENGSPLIIVISSSAVRANALVKTLKTLNVKVAKLFAKHLKFQAQVEMLTSEKYPIVSGTSTRMIKLIENGALKTSLLKYVILDSSYKDAKERTIFDIPESLDDLKLLIQKLSSQPICLF